MYCERTGDSSRKEDAIRQLKWATYMVDVDGKNRYPDDDIWLTDGYGDYLRHYLRAMAAAPELAPAGQNHLLRSSSVAEQIQYQPNRLRYRTFDARARERLRVAFEPIRITAGRGRLKQVKQAEELAEQDGYWYAASGPLKGVLEVRHSKSGEIVGAPAP